MASDHEDDDFNLPPETQRPFTSGIRRKPVPFVRSSDLDTTSTPSTTSGRSVADAYLSIVMKQTPSTVPSTPACPPSPTRETASAPATAQATPPPEPAQKPSPELCEVCQLPLGTNPNRTRAGFRYLTNRGWDPDERLGLGASGREGIREPIKASMKFDTAALGTGLDKDGDPLPKKPAPVKVQKLNAKQVRKKAMEDKAKGERMMKAFHQDERILKYLGEDV
ncbi:unnamed protein product [Penicillium bialowiezense]